MALKKILVKGYVLNPDDFSFPVDFDNPIDQQKRITVGDVLKYLSGVQHGFDDRDHLL